MLYEGGEEVALLDDAVIFLMLLKQPPPLITAHPITGLILGLRPANERRRYFVTTSLIGWAQA